MNWVCPPEIECVYNVFCHSVSYNRIGAAARARARARRAHLFFQLVLLGLRIYEVICKFQESRLFPLGLRELTGFAPPEISGV